MTVQRLLNETTSLGMNEEAIKNGFNMLVVSWGEKCNMRVPLTTSDLTVGLVLLDTVDGDCEYIYA